MNRQFRVLLLLVAVLLFAGMTTHVSSAQIEWAPISLDNAANLVATGTLTTDTLWGITLDTMSFSPDGNTLAVATFKGVELLNLKDNQAPINFTNSIALNVAFSPDGKKLAVFGIIDKNLALYLLDVSSSKILWSAFVLNRLLAGIAFSPDGTRLAITSNIMDIISDQGIQDSTGMIQVFDTTNGDQLLSFSHASSVVARSFFSPDSHSVAYSTQKLGGETFAQWQIHFVDLETGEESQSLDSDGYATAFSPDWNWMSVSNLMIMPYLTPNAIGRFYRYGLKTGIRSLKKGGEFTEFPAALPTKGHSLDFINSSFSPDGKILAVSGVDSDNQGNPRDSYVQFWDANNLQQIGSLDIGKGLVTEGRFSPDGNMLVTLQLKPNKDTGIVQLWRALPAGVCTVVPPTNANLRAGPGTNYAKAGTLAAKTNGYADGQVPDAKNKKLVWFRLISGGWVRSDLVKAADTCAKLPTVEAPPV